MTITLVDQPRGHWPMGRHHAPVIRGPW